MENSISKIVRKLAKQYREENQCTLWQINNGLCGEFFDDLLVELGGYGPETYDLVTDNFFNIMGEEGSTAAFKDDNGKYYFEHYGVFPSDLDPDGFYDIGYHVWLYHQGKHYDAEAPEGVTNFFDLPIFQRAINRYRRKQLQNKKPDFFTHKTLNEGLNLIKKPNVTYEIVMSQFRLYADINEQYDITLKDYFSEVGYLLLVINNVGDNNLHNIVLKWRQEEPYEISAICETIVNDILGDYDIVLEVMMPINKPETIANDLIEFVNNLIHQLNNQTLYEGLNLMKKKQPDWRYFALWICLWGWTDNDVCDGGWDVLNFKVPGKYLTHIESVFGLHDNDTMYDILRIAIYDGIIDKHYYDHANEIIEMSRDEYCDMTDCDEEDLMEGLNLPKKVYYPYATITKMANELLGKHRKQMLEQGWYIFSSNRTPEFEEIHGTSKDGYYLVVEKIDQPEIFDDELPVGILRYDLEAYSFARALGIMITDDGIIYGFNGEKVKPTIHEGLNLPKKETMDRVELPNVMDKEQKRYAKIGYRVGWIDAGKFRYGTVYQIFRLPGQEVVVVIQPDDIGNTSSIELPVSQLIAGAVL